MWQALADEGGIHPWPERPAAGRFQDGIAWWVPAVELLAYSLAWPRLDIGLRWWCHAGRPVDDSRLAMIDQMLGADVDELLAWLLTSAKARQLESHIADATATELPDHPRLAADSEWLDAVLARAGDRMSPYAGEGGSDPLHLYDHACNAVSDGEDDNASIARLIAGTADTRSAVLLIDRYGGWYRELARYGATLPALANNRSWRVDVLCRPVGCLGTFRRSRLTGRWFAGRHRFHSKGWQS